MSRERQEERRVAGSESCPRRVIFCNRLGRPASVKKALAWPLRTLLNSRAKQYIADKRPQLVVFSFDYISNIINVDGAYERDELDTFFLWMASLHIETKSWTVLDIGANIGNHSLYFSDHFRKVLSFEPNPRTYKVLCLNAELSQNIACFNFGLSDEAGDAMLSIDPNNVGGSHITSLRAENTQSISLRTLDSLSLTDDIKLMKIDVEGYEWKVINGAKKLIRDKKPVILFEQQKTDFREGRSAVISLLSELGYEHFAVIKRYPRIDGGIAKKLVLVPLLGILVGRSIEVRIERDIRPDLYQFIVALPDWMPIMG